jgi:hypothetical protein
MKIIKLAIVAISVAVASFAFAGLVQPAPVMITLNEDNSGFAQGDMLTARYSDNDVEFIGCGTRTIEAGGPLFHFGFCQATDSEGNMAFCSTNDADLLTSMRATADYSFVTFGFNTDGVCTRIGFSTQSFYLPNKVQKKSKGSKKNKD